MEASKTIESYSQSAALELRAAIRRNVVRLLEERVEIPYEIFFDVVPEEPLAFFSLS